MDEQLTQLKAGLADLKDALSQAVTRIDAKLSALQNNNPDLSEEIQDVRDDIAVVQGLAADQTASTAQAPAADQTAQAPGAPTSAPTSGPDTTATAGVANTEPAATADGTTAAPATPAETTAPADQAPVPAAADQGQSAPAGDGTVTA